jgi:hypothetical protein
VNLELGGLRLSSPLQVPNLPAEKAEALCDANGRACLEWVLRRYFHHRAFHKRLERCQKGEEKEKSQTPAFENKNLVRSPDVVESP